MIFVTISATLIVYIIISSFIIIIRQSVINSSYIDQMHDANWCYEAMISLRTSKPCKHST